MEDKKLIRLILICILILVIGTGASIFTYMFWHIQDITTIDLFLIINGRTGIAGDKDKIHFGMVPPLGIGVKKIVVTNTNKNPSKVILTKKGDISKFISFSDNDFILKYNESKIVTVQSIIPAVVEFGNYTGKLRVIQYRVKN